jgi:hypothetical protein
MNTSSLPEDWDYGTASWIYYGHARFRYDLLETTEDDQYWTVIATLDDDEQYSPKYTGTVDKYWRPNGDGYIVTPRYGLKRGEFVHGQPMSVLHRGSGRLSMKMPHIQQKILTDMHDLISTIPKCAPEEEIDADMVPPPVPDHDRDATAQSTDELKHPNTNIETAFKAVFFVRGEELARQVLRGNNVKDVSRIVAAIRASEVMRDAGVDATLEFSVDHKQWLTHDQAVQTFTTLPNTGTLTVRIVRKK